MKNLSYLTKAELAELLQELSREYEALCARHLKLDMSRGKPGPEQLDLSKDLLTAWPGDDPNAWITENGVDARNYGVLDGVPEAKRLMAELLDTTPDRVIIGGQASLGLMYDVLTRAMLFGVLGSTPWCQLPKVKFLCPVPGYDRHFRITEALGIEMINIPTDDKGPDMDLVEDLVKDETVKGIWCVPRFSNPGGVVYSDETVRRIAALKPAAKDFRVMWDNAYCVHDLYPGAPELLNILVECEKAGNPDLVYEFASTSKITLPGAGISIFASSPANVAEQKKHLGVQAINYDKLNQLRHVAFLKDKANIKAHMEKQAALMRPKFELVLETLERELGGLGVGSWTKPMGGYFISFCALPGCAKIIVERCRQAGITLTGAGAAYPYGRDPEDSNIRIAPTYPSLEELRQAADGFALCVKLTAAEKKLNQN